MVPGEPRSGAYVGDNWRHARGPQQLSHVQDTAWTTTVAKDSASAGVGRAGADDRKGIYTSGDEAATVNPFSASAGDWRKEAK